MRLSHTNVDSKTIELKIDNFPDFVMDGRSLTRPDNGYTIEEIDEELFDYLISNTEDESTCIVKYNIHYVDTYGKNQVSDWEEFRPIDLTELRKFESVNHWVTSTGGIVRLKYGDDRR